MEKLCFLPHRFFTCLSKNTANNFLTLMYELEQKSQNAGNRTYEVLDFKISPGEDSYLRIPLEM